jgi:hypothetical protein
MSKFKYFSYITRWLATNGKVEEGVLSEGSHSSAGYSMSNQCESFIYVDLMVKKGRS